MLDLSFEITDIRDLGEKYENPNAKTTLILSGNELDEKGVAVIKDFTEKRKYTIIY